MKWCDQSAMNRTMNLRWDVWLRLRLSVEDERGDESEGQEDQQMM